MLIVPGLRCGLVALPILRGGFGVGEFFITATVAELPDQRPGLRQFTPVVEEAGAVQVDVGEVQSGIGPRRSIFPASCSLRSTASQSPVQCDRLAAGWRDGEIFAKPFQLELRLDGNKPNIVSA